MYILTFLISFLFTLAAQAHPQTDPTDCNRLLHKLSRQQLAVAHFEDYGGGFSHHRVMVQSKNKSIIPTRIKEYDALETLENNYEIRGLKDHWALMSLSAKMLEHYLRAGGEYRIQSGEGEPSLDAAVFDGALKFFKDKKIAVLHSMKQADSKRVAYDKNILVVFDGNSKGPHVKLIQLNHPSILYLINKNYKFTDPTFGDTKEKIFGKLAEKYINTRHNIAVEKLIVPDTYEDMLGLTSESISDIIEHFKDKSMVVLDSQYTKNGGATQSKHQIFALHNSTFYKIILNNKAIFDAFKDLHNYNQEAQSDSQMGFFAKLFEKYFFAQLKQGKDVKPLLTQKELSPDTVHLIFTSHFNEVLD